MEWIQRLAHHSALYYVLEGTTQRDKRSWTSWSALVENRLLLGGVSAGMPGTCLWMLAPWVTL